MDTTNKFWFDNVELRPAPWPGLMWMTAIITVKDVQKARDLYINTFDFVSIFDATHPDHNNEIVTTRLRWRGANVLVVKEGFDLGGKSPATTDTTPPVVFYVYVDDVKAVYKKALEAGMTSVQEPKVTFWGDLRARVRCPNGYLWDIAQRVQ